MKWVGEVREREVSRKKERKKERYGKEVARERQQEIYRNMEKMSKVDERKTD